MLYNVPGAAAGRIRIPAASGFPNVTKRTHASKPTQGRLAVAPCYTTLRFIPTPQKRRSCSLGIGCRMTEVSTHSRLAARKMLKCPDVHFSLAGPGANVVLS